MKTRRAQKPAASVSILRSRQNQKTAGGSESVAASPSRSTASQRSPLEDGHTIFWAYIKCTPGSPSRNPAMRRKYAKLEAMNTQKTGTHIHSALRLDLS